MPRTLAILYYLYPLVELVMGFIKERQLLLNSYKRLMKQFPKFMKDKVRFLDGWMSQNKQRISLI